MNKDSIQATELIIDRYSHLPNVRIELTGYKDNKKVTLRWDLNPTQVSQISTNTNMGAIKHE